MKRKQTTISIDEVRAELETLAITFTPKYRPWSATEIQLVREFYGRVPAHALAARLGRSVTSVKCCYQQKVRP